MPFFLFTGVLVPRIYAQAAEWAAAHPDVEVVAGAHLGPDRRLARLVLERYREARDRRRAHELRPLHLPRAAPGLRGQGRHADLADAARRRARPRGSPRAPGDAGAGEAPAAAAGGRRHGGPTILSLRRAAVRVSGRDGGAGRREPAGRGGRAGRACSGPNGAGKTTLALAACGALEDLRGTVSVGETTLARETRARDPPPRRDRLPGRRRPALHADRRGGRRVRSGQPGTDRRRAARARRTRRWTRCACRSWRRGRRTR